MKNQIVIAYLICLSPFFVIAQTVTGFWKGTLNMNKGCFPVNHIELQITIKGDSIYGNSYHYLDVNNYVKKNFTGSYQPALKKIFLQEELVTTFKIPSHCKVCIKKYELAYTREVNQEFLEGDWSGVLMGTSIDCETGPIKLSRIKESAFKEIPEIIVDTGEIRLDFYDNGQIDDDTISVTINNRTVLSNQRLGEKPITTFVRIDLKNTFHEVKMIAENLGSIPPNTALLIITAGIKRYELFLTSSDKKTATVRFLYEKGNLEH
ncbi:MAG: hypothetical protein WKF97_13740 [Chitinophagaceae bacterium]